VLEGRKKRRSRSERPSGGIERENGMGWIDVDTSQSSVESGGGKWRTREKVSGWMKGRGGGLLSRKQTRKNVLRPEPMKGKAALVRKGLKRIGSIGGGGGVDKKARSSYMDRNYSKMHDDGKNTTPNEFVMMNENDDRSFAGMDQAWFKKVVSNVTDVAAAATDVATFESRDADVADVDAVLDFVFIGPKDYVPPGESDLESNGSASSAAVVSCDALSDSKKIDGQNGATASEGVFGNDDGDHGDEENDGAAEELKESVLPHDDAHDVGSNADDDECVSDCTGAEDEEKACCDDEDEIAADDVVLITSGCTEASVVEDVSTACEAEHVVVSLDKISVGMMAHRFEEAEARSKSKIDVERLVKCGAMKRDTHAITLCPSLVVLAHRFESTRA